MNVSIIDTNVNISRWPFRRLPFDTTTELVEKLKSQGVKQAWTGSFDGILHRDISSVNSRLYEECKKVGQGILMPFGTIHPGIFGWEEELVRCAEQYKMHGIRLYPNYHNYLLTDERFLKILSLAQEKNLLVQICITMEDRRTQHPLVSVPNVDTKPLLKIAKQFPKVKIQLLNAFRSVRAATAGHLAATGNISFEIAMLEGVAGIEKMLKKMPLPQLLFGSHFPFFIFESAKLKLSESELEEHQMKAICYQNAEKLVKSI